MNLSTAEILRVSAAKGRKSTPSTKAVRGKKAEMVNHRRQPPSGPTASKATKLCQKRITLNLSSPQQDFVCVIVGAEPDSKRFVVHKKALCHYSPFFDTAFNSGFIEGKTQTMTLDDVDIPVFGLLVNWVYTQNIEFTGSKDESVELIHLAKLWTLGGRVLIPNLQNETIDIVQEALKNMQLNCSAEHEMLKGFIHHAYKTAEETPLKRLAVDHIFKVVSAANVDKWLDDFPDP